MQEIAENVFIEKRYPRVVLGLIKLKHGVVMVDCPFQIEDVQMWKTKARQVSSGLKRFLLLLDAHIDRTMMVKAMETDVVSHEDAVDTLRNQSAASKNQELEIGPGWTHSDLPSGARIFHPHMTFTEELRVHWDDNPLLISHTSGAHFAGTWLTYDQQRVVFVGDSVIIDQPPFFTHADLSTWIKDLDLLSSNRYENYKIISGRNGLIHPESVRKFSALLNEIKNLVEELTKQALPLAGVPELTSYIMRKSNFDPRRWDQYCHRLSWGLEQYIKRHSFKQETGEIGENE